jgi:hypothetical protein
VLGALLDPAWELTTSRDAGIPGAELLVDGVVVEQLPAPGSLVGAGQSTGATLT